MLRCSVYRLYIRPIFLQYYLFVLGEGEKDRKATFIEAQITGLLSSVNGTNHYAFRRSMLLIYLLGFSQTVQDCVNLWKRVYAFLCDTVQFPEVYTEAILPVFLGNYNDWRTFGRHGAIIPCSTNFLTTI